MELLTIDEVLSKIRANQRDNSTTESEPKMFIEWLTDFSTFRRSARAGKRVESGNAASDLSGPQPSPLAATFFEEL
jgi:hypothetical protein